MRLAERISYWFANGKPTMEGLKYFQDLEEKLPIVGIGTPEGAVTAPVGRLYVRTDGGAATTLYVKESGSGNTGWVAK